jgi:hypothetical protein
VLSPTWRSGPGPRTIQEQGKGKDKGDKKDQKDQKVRPPERGMFGSIDVWEGHLAK